MSSLNTNKGKISLTDDQVSVIKEIEDIPGHSNFRAIIEEKLDEVGGVTLLVNGSSSK